MNNPISNDEDDVPTSTTTTDHQETSVLSFKLSSLPNVQTLRKNPLVYTPYYCEENALQLYSYLTSKLSSSSSSSSSSIVEGVEKVDSSSPSSPVVSELYSLQSTNSYVIFITNPCKQCPVWYQKASQHPSEPVIWDYHVVLSLPSSFFPSLSSSSSRSSNLSISNPPPTITSTHSSSSSSIHHSSFGTVYPSTVSLFLSSVSPYFILDPDSTLDFPLSIYEYFISITTGLSSTTVLLNDYYRTILASLSESPPTFEGTTGTTVELLSRYILEQLWIKVLNYQRQFVRSMYHPYFRIVSIQDMKEYFASDRQHMWKTKNNNSQTVWNAPPPVWDYYSGTKAKKYGITYNLDNLLDVLPLPPSSIKNDNNNTVVKNVPVAKNKEIEDTLKYNASVLPVPGKVVDLEGLLTFFGTVKP